MKYPYLKEKSSINICAPSSGTGKELEHLAFLAQKQLIEEGFTVVIHPLTLQQHKAKSASYIKRANAINTLMTNEETDMLFPIWGGELALELLPYLEFEAFKEKWILGYSDTSGLLLAITLKTGIATAHGTNAADVRGEQYDSLTGLWKNVLSTKKREYVTQFSSEKFQSEWNFEEPTDIIFHLDTETNWKIIGDDDIKVSGRLLGGCVDIIRHLIGTPFGDIGTFREKHTNKEPLIWFFENCQLSATDLRRSLLQMQYSGWFKDTVLIMFGRSAIQSDVEGYETIDVYKDISHELKIPIVYDIDCGHVPPNMTFVNGAYADVYVSDGRGKVVQHFI